MFFFEFKPSPSAPLTGVNSSGQQPYSELSHPGHPSLLGPLATVSPSLQQP